MENELFPMGTELLEFQLLLASWNKTNMKNIFPGNIESVTIQQFHILMMIEKGGLHTISQMSEFIGLSKSGLSLSISRMVQEGYLRKEFPVGDEDGRKVYFFVSQKGEKAIADIMERYTLCFQKFYDSLIEEKQEDLKMGITLLKRVYRQEEKK